MAYDSISKSMRYDRINVLVVDDNRHMRLIIVTILRSFGVQKIFECRDGTEGLLAMQRHSIDVVMTDLKMWPMDGIEFVRKLRSGTCSRSREVPVVMISADATLARITEARDASVDQFLAKPFSPRRLVQALHHAILYPRPNVVYVEVVID